MMTALNEILQSLSIIMLGIGMIYLSITIRRMLKMMEHLNKLAVLSFICSR